MIESSARISLLAGEAHNGNPVPLFEASASEIKVTFYTDIAGDKFVDKFVVNETQREIIKMMLEQPTVSARTIATNVGMTARGIQKNIDALKKVGLVERIGAAKSGHWAVKLPNDTINI